MTNAAPISSAKLTDTVKGPLRWRLAAFLCRYTLGAWLLFNLWPRPFLRELQAVMLGRSRQLGGSKINQSLVYRLRRNVHRLEKGLVMRPRRPMFAADYIADTVAAYEDLVSECKQPVADDSEMEWFGDVLAQYFDVVELPPGLEGLREVFEKVRPPKESSVVRAPDLGEVGLPPPVTGEAFAALAKRRRSVRFFQSRRVPRALIDTSILAAREAPSACNRQPYRFHVFDVPEDAQAIGALAGGTRGFSHNFVALAVVVGDLSAFADSKDRHLIYIDASLAVMSFVLSLESQGLSSCVINWPEVPRAERRMAEALGLQPYERPICLVSFGYADLTAVSAFSEKKSLDHVRTYHSRAPLDETDD